MNERSIFLAALEITDAAQRSTYLDQVCGNDAGLLRVPLLASQQCEGQMRSGPKLGWNSGEFEESRVDDREPLSAVRSGCHSHCWQASSGTWRGETLQTDRHSSDWERSG